MTATTTEFTTENTTVSLHPTAMTSARSKIPAKRAKALRSLLSWSSVRCGGVQVLIGPAEMQMRHTRYPVQRHCDHSKNRESVYDDAGVRCVGAK